MKRWAPWVLAVATAAGLALAGSNGVGTGGLSGPPSGIGSGLRYNGVNDVGDSGVVIAGRFIALNSDPGTVVDGGANFVCLNNPATSSPCLSNPNKPLEFGGVKASLPEDDSAAIYAGCMLNADGGSCLDVLNNYGAPGGGSEVTLGRFMHNGDLRMKRWLYLNGEQGTDGRIITNGLFYNMSGGTIIMWNQAATTVQQWFSGAGGTLLMSLTAAGFLDIENGPSSNSCTLDGASPSKCTITTVAGAKCVCSVISTAGAAPCTVNLVTTTLTAYSSNGLTNVVNVACF